MTQHLLITTALAVTQSLSENINLKKKKLIDAINRYTQDNQIDDKLQLLSHAYYECFDKIHYDNQFIINIATTMRIPIENVMHILTAPYTWDIIIHNVSYSYRKTPNEIYELEPSVILKMYMLAFIQKIV